MATHSKKSVPLVKAPFKTRKKRLDGPAAIASIEAAQRYYERIDWSEMWDDFYLRLGVDGLPYYRSVAQFATQHAKKDYQESFIRWFCGPRKAAHDKQNPYPFVLGGAQDWKKKREKNGWDDEDHLKKITKDITIRSGALDKLQAVGDAFALRYVARIETLFEKMDNVFHVMFIPGANENDNMLRARQYFRLYGTLGNMMAKALETYSRSQGININMPEGVVALLQANDAIARASSGKEGSTGVQRAMEDIASMMLVKAARHGTPVPEDIGRRVLDMVVANDEVKTGKKNTN